MGGRPRSIHELIEEDKPLPESKSGTYCFRIRFFLTGGAHIDLPGTSVVLSDQHAAEQVKLVAHGDPPPLLATSSHLVLTGGKYVTEDDALQAGEQWRGSLEVGFAACNLGADFGDFAPSGGLTNAGAEMFSKQIGRPVLTDVHGLSAFVCEPRPAFFSATANISVGRAGDHVVANIRSARAECARFDADKRVAYQLFSSSVTMPSPDARFLTLMTAIETLIRPAPRSDAARDLVQGFVEQLRQADLPDSERRSMLGSLRFLNDQSISQAGRILAGRLEDQTYGQKVPAKFFTTCYDLRSRLVHGLLPRPSFTEINGTVGELERFTRDLLLEGVMKPDL